MKILITGGNGFVGREIIRHLVSKTNFQVVAMVRNLSEIDLIKNVDYRVGEISSDFKLEIKLNDIDVIIHTAGKAHLINNISKNDLNEFREVNTTGTIDLANLAIKNSVKRFIFLSSIKVNGEETDIGKPFTRKSIPNPQDAYGLSKYEAEVKLLELVNQSPLDVVIIRAPLVYGPRSKGNFKLLLNLLSKEIPLPFGSISGNRRSLVSVFNLCSLIDVCISHQNAANKIFFVSDNSDLSSAQMIKSICHIFNYNLFLFRFPKVLLIFIFKLIGLSKQFNKFTGSLQVDISDTCNDLDWNPPLSFDESLKEFKELEGN